LFWRNARFRSTMVWRNSVRTSRRSGSRNGLDCSIRYVTDPESCPNWSYQTVAFALSSSTNSSVYQELASSKRDVAPAIDFAAEPWLVVATPSDRKHVEELREHLDPGESEAIVLAIERGADFLLVDERRGRRGGSNSHRSPRRRGPCERSGSDRSGQAS